MSDDETVSVSRATLRDWARRITALEELVIAPAKEATHTLAGEVALTALRKAGA